MQRRLALIFALGLLGGGLTAPVAAQTPDETIALIRDAATAHGVSGDWLVSVARCETGGTFNPRAVGDGGTSFGLFQIHDGGLLALFRQRGGLDPFNVWEASDFAAWAFSQGMSRHWTCARGR